MSDTEPAQPVVIPPTGPLTWRVFHCHCGYPVFFRNHTCLHCKRALGYEPESAQLLALDPAGETTFQAAGAAEGSTLYRRCANHTNAARCNWLLPVAADGSVDAELCRCCRLNRVVPDLSVPANALLWGRVEIGKRRLVSSLIALGLPVASRVGEDNERGLAFDLLVNAPDAPPVMTGHHNGIITLNVMEADDATREAVRSQMQEPYRTVLGHLRHESGHYYWSRLLDGSTWQEPFRALFGDERQDYGQALQRHHASGPPMDWMSHFVSGYASAHPWEDWAETWAHYLHMLDTRDTALSAGIDSSRAGLLMDPFPAEVLYQAPDDETAPGEPPDDTAFLDFVNNWVELTNILNELSRSMGLPDFYPFVLSREVVTKLHFVHRFVTSGNWEPLPPVPAVEAMPADMPPAEAPDEQAA